MSKVRLKFKPGAQYDLRRAPGVVELLEQIGTDVVEQANETLPENVGYRMSSSQGAKRPYGRWAVRVYTSSNHAKNSNAVHNTLLRIVNSI